MKMPEGQKLNIYAFSSWFMQR